MRSIKTKQIKEIMNEKLLAEIESHKMWNVLACIVKFFFIIRMIEKCSLNRHSWEVSSLFYERVLIWIWPVGYQWISVALQDGRKNELSWIAFRSSENGKIQYQKLHASKTIRSVSSWYSCKAPVSCQYWHSKWRGISSAILSDVIRWKRRRKITDGRSNFKETCVSL